MKRFRFPLEKALEVRGLRRLLAEQKLGEARREEDRVRARLSTACLMRDRCFDEMRTAASGRVDPAVVQHLARYERGLEDEVMRHRTDLARKAEATRRAVDQVVERSREERALEKYREDRFSQYRKRYWWEQGKALDELASQRFAREKGGE